MTISQPAVAQTIPVVALTEAPLLDGNGEDWQTDNVTVVALRNITPDRNVATEKVAVSAGVFADRVYFYLVWEDATHDKIHKPWNWDAKKEKYTRGSEREDRVAIQFKISGDYTTDWFSGKEFVADMWHWKSSRSNPLDIVHDKSTTISKQKLLRSYSTVNKDGDTIYLARPSDEGSKLYLSKRYHQYQGDQVPKYALSDTVSGSVADVSAKGVWKNGKWHVELSRALVTGHADDVEFSRGKTVEGGLAIFDQSENDKHAISETLLFSFD